MGFKKDSYATVWTVEKVSDSMTKCRISISRKDKNTGEYVQDFSGFASFIGAQTAAAASTLKEKDRIRLGDVDVSTTYNKEKDTTYTNFKVFNFTMADNAKSASNGSVPQTPASEGDSGSEDLPF